MSNSHYIVVDAGNTRIKVAVFHHSDIQTIKTFTAEQFDQLKSFLHPYKNFLGIISSVRSEKNTKWIKSLLPASILFHQKLYPILKNQYETPETLGMDRLANAIAAANISQTNALVIDVGTCIKYDVVSFPNNYLGGSISPGIELRYKSMHHFTGKLPLITDFNTGSLTGTSTLSAMRSGVMQGITFEMKGFISEYLQKFPDLTIFLTGGDAHYFDLGNNYNIFADENLTLKGLLIALLHAQKNSTSSH